MKTATLTPATGGFPRLLASILALVSSACISVQAPPACTLSERDRAWLDRALEAWRFTSREITGVKPVPDFQGVFFSADCTLQSSNALGSATGVGITWMATPHDGTVTFPDGSTMEAAVTAFVSGEEDVTYFAMSVPTVWEAAGIGEGAELDTTLIAVLLHEGSHVAQTSAYGERLGTLIKRNNLPASFNDNAVQQRFRDNPEFAESVSKETQLFLEAAAANDLAEAKRLAREGRRLMRERQAKWMVGDDAYLVEAEDIWLTFEGSGQWTGYQWQIHPRGGAKPTEEVLARNTRGRQWSQTEGFAVVMALDRIAGPGWKMHAFGDGTKTVLEMLDEAIEDE